MSYPIPMGRIRLTRPIRSEDHLFRAGLGLSAPAGTFPFTMNQHGAVSVILADGVLLGVKPDEFEWVEVTEELTVAQREAWARTGKSPVPFMRINLDDRTMAATALIDRHGNTIEAALAFIALADSR